MSAVEADKAMFAKALKALGPYLGELVVVGGWAHRLFGLHPMARAPGFQPLMTEDADIAAPVSMQKRGESIAALLKREGFAETFFGDETPPVSEYRIGDDDGGLYLEFLVPLIGGEHRRDGSRKATATIAGVSAQRLRYIDIVIAGPWTIRLSDQKGYPVGRAGLDVRIANAACYLAQKLLVFRERKPDKQAKDLLYIHDTLLIFSHSLDELGVLWQRIEPTLHPNTLRALARRRSEVLASVTDPARNAAVIAASTGRSAHRRAAPRYMPRRPGAGLRLIADPPGSAPRSCLSTAVSAYTAVVELVKEALRDPSVREEIIAIVSSNHRASATQVAGSEPLIDAREAAKLLSMSVAAVRAAAYRGTLRSHHVGRLLRFRQSELLPERG